MAFSATAADQNPPDADLYFRRTGVRDHALEHAQGKPFQTDVPLTPSAVPLLNGVDAYNLGKGDWIWQMSSCISALGVGTVQGFVDYEKNKGMQWITVKSHDGGTTYPSAGSPQFTSDLITRVHAAGMKIYAWGYCYGRNVQGEINQADAALNLGADGYIIDSEIEYETNNFRAVSAVRMCQGIRAAHPNKFLAYAPFPYINSHLGYTYVQFGMYCDAVMPQDYWGDIGVSPTTMIANMDSQWTSWQNGLTGYQTNAIRPIIPIGQTYNAVPGSEVTTFIDTLKADATPASKYGYHGVSFWSCQHRNADQWTAVGAASMTVKTNPPAIANTPLNRSIEIGSNATFSVTAFGATPLSYQWRLNGTNIAGATSASYTVASAQFTNAGNYTVVITNSAGSITSAAATLKANAALPVLQLAFSDAFETNSSSLWDVFQGSGNGVSDYTANFNFNYTSQTYATLGMSDLTTFTTSNIPIAPNTTNGTRSALRLTVNSDATAALSGVSLYPAGRNFGSNCVLRFDMWINYPGGPQGGLATGSTEYLTCGLNHSGSRVNWNTSSTSSDGTWFAVDGEGGSGGSDYRAYQGTGGTPTELSFANSGFSANGAQGQNYLDLFYGSLFPSPTYETPGAPGKKWVQCELSQINGLLTWKLNNVIVAQRTNTSAYTSGNIMIGYMDLFTSIASPAADSFALIDNVRVYTVVTPPSVVSAPTNRIVNIGATAAFAVTASGTAPLNYQWRFNGTNLPSATTNLLSITNAQIANAGTYSIVVSNAAGAFTNSATLEVVPMQISNYLLNTNGEFQVTVSGAPGADYVLYGSTNLLQWDILSIRTNTNGIVQFYDPGTTNFPERYYRIGAPE